MDYFCTICDFPPLLLGYRAAIGVQGELRLGSVRARVRVGLKWSYCESKGSDDEEPSARLWSSEWNLWYPRIVRLRSLGTPLGRANTW